MWSWCSRSRAAFFTELGEARCAKLEAVTIDISGAYIKAVTEASPQAQIILFHVQRLAQDAVDEVRRDEVRAATESRTILFFLVLSTILIFSPPSLSSR